MKVTNIQSLKNILSENGYKITKAREDTFSVLLSPEPQSMAALIDKAHTLRLPSLTGRYHHHLSCLSCGKVIDIEDEKHINEFIKSVTDKFNFTPRHHQFEIDGFCSVCSESKKVRVV